MFYESLISNLYFYSSSKSLLLLHLLVVETSTSSRVEGQGQAQKRVWLPTLTFGAQGEATIMTHVMLVGRVVILYAVMCVRPPSTSCASKSGAMPVYCVVVIGMVWKESCL